MIEFIKRSNDKSKLRSCFRLAELTRTKTINKTKYEILPTIHSIDYDKPEYTQYVFTLPNGVDPKLIEKKEFVFKQCFGERIEITGKLKKFVLKVYKKSLNKIVPYDFIRFSKHAKKEKYKLPILCGDETTNGNIVMFDMTTHPHILNGGQTGGGKSTWLRAILIFLIQFMSPDEIHLYLCDLKAVEFMLFRNVKHVKKMATDVESVVEILDQLNKELDKRQKLMVQHEATHIDKVPNHPPYIVCVIDEFQDLRGNDKAMDKLMRLGAKGRALGVFLVLTTQRPSVAIVDGDIKANLTVSMAFKTKNRLNSNMILDPGSPDASKLKGNGHGIVSIDDYYEVQSPLLEEEDARKILANYKQPPNCDDITDLVEVQEVEDTEESPLELNEEGPLE